MAGHLLAPPERMEEGVVMRLYEKMLDMCVLMGTVRERDEEGGWNTVWREGRRFAAAIVMDNTLQARVAESEGMTSTYTVTARKGTHLRFHDVFKRLSDGKVFRVTANAVDKETPEAATFQFEQVAAESWELPQ